MQKYGFDDARPVLERASRPGDRGPGRARRGRRGVPRSRRSASRLVSHIVAIGPVAVPDDAELPGPDDVAAPRRRPGALPRRRRPARRWWPRSTPAAADGDTLGGVVEVLAYGLPPGPGQPRALGPAARLPAGRRADGHPGDQGRRGRRRLPHRGPARLAGARRDRARRAGRRPAPQRPRRRHRGRHDHRRGAAGARGDEADLHRAAGAGHRRRRHRRAGGGDQPALRRLRGARPRASWPRRWWRWCWPTPCWRSSAATPSPRVRRNLRGLPRRHPASRCGPPGEHARGEWRRPPARAGRPARAPARPPSARAGRRRLDVPFARHRRRRRARAGKPIADIFVDDGEPAFRELERDAVAAALAEHDGVLALGGGAVLDPRTEALLAGHTGGVPGRADRRRRAADRPGRRPAAAGRQPAGAAGPR